MLDTLRGENLMRVLLINTPHPLEENPVLPLSLSYLAAALQREGIEVEILDLLVARYSKGKVRDKLGQYRPQVVGVTCVTLNYPTAARILKVCKEFDPAITTVIGGPHATFALKDTLLRAPWIDIVVRGEGDEAVVELVRVLEKGADLHGVAGIAFRKDGAVAQTGPRPLIEGLDGLPLPARHLLPISKYRALGAPCTVVTSRGCPFGCIFCSAPAMFGRRVRFRHPKLVVDEIEMVHNELGFERINIVDDTFTANPRHAGEVCNEILRRNLKVEWSVYSRVDTITEDLAKLLKEAGCAWILFGVESADEAILKTINKGITRDKVRAGVRLATESGMKVFNSFILGLPGESPQTARASLAFAQELNRDYDAKYGFHILSPLPGTELYDKADEYGLRILTRNWARYDANEPITESDSMRPQDVMEVMSDYDRMVGSVWEEMKRRAEAGDPLYVKEVREQATKEFVWKLLKDDVIERVGRVKPGDGASAEEGLAQRVSQRLAVPSDVALREIGGLVQQGLITREQAGGAFIWKWS